MQKIMQDALLKDFPDAKVAILDIRRCILYDANVSEEIKIPYNLEQEALMWKRYAEED